MKERTKKILLASVDHFIKYGKPVTSERLFKFYDFGIKSAMIRWELNKLSKKGYFSQPHPSGGRFPTNKAYRFFIENLYKEKEKTFDYNNFLKSLAEKLLRGDIEKFIDEVSEKMGVLSVGYKINERHLYLNGLYDLLNNLDFFEKEEFLEIVRDFENFPRRIITERWEKYLEENSKRPKIFVGKNKFIRSDVVSVFADCIDSQNDKFVIFMIGPKRMDYEKLFKLFKIVSRLEENYF